MEPNDIHQPHDRLVKQIFSRRETATAFLQAYLPLPLGQVADWNGLELRPGSYIDARLRHQESDLLFSVPVKGQALLI